VNLVVPPPFSCFCSWETASSINITKLFILFPLAILFFTMSLYSGVAFWFFSPYTAFSLVLTFFVRSRSFSLFFSPSSSQPPLVILPPPLPLGFSSFLGPQSPSQVHCPFLPRFCTTQNIEAPPPLLAFFNLVPDELLLPLSLKAMQSPFLLPCGS